MGVYFNEISEFVYDCLSSAATEENEENQNFLIATVAIGAILSLGLLYRCYYEGKSSTTDPCLENPSKVPEIESFVQTTSDEAETSSATTEEKGSKSEQNSFSISQPRNQALNAEVAETESFVQTASNEARSATFEEKASEFPPSPFLTSPWQNQALDAATLINNGLFDDAVSLIAGSISEIIRNNSIPSSEKKIVLDFFIRHVFANSENIKTRSDLFSFSGLNRLYMKLAMDLVNFSEFEMDLRLIWSLPYENLSILKTPSDFYIETEKPVFIINPVISDGFGDLGIALELINKYSKKIRGKFHLMVFSTDEHLEKIRSQFNHTFNGMKNVAVEPYTCENLFEDVSKILSIVENRMKQLSPCAAIVASSGIHFPKLIENLDLDAFHEIGGGSSFRMAPLVHLETKLQIPFGFDEYSAGVLLPDSVDSSLEEVLSNSGLLRTIAGNVCEGKEDFNEFLLRNHITLMYVDNSFKSSTYFDFLEKLGSKQNKHIHVIFPTSNPNLLNRGKEIKSEHLCIYYCSSIESTHFDALTQKSTVPPAIKGNTSFLNAIVGNTPFFYDPRGYTIPVIQQFVELSNKYKEKIGDSTIEFLTQILSLANHQVYTLASCSGPPKGCDLGIFFALHEKSIREGFCKLHQILREHHNAEPFVCNLLRKRIESLKTQDC